MTINFKQVEKVMKKEAKKGLIYLLRDEQENCYYLGTRNFTVRFESLHPNIHSKFAALGLIEVNTALNAGRAGQNTEHLTANLRNILKRENLEHATLTDFLCRRDKLTLSLIRTDSGGNVYVDEQLSSIFTDTTWQTSGIYSPVHTVDGVVMPVRLTEDPLKQLLGEEN